MAPGQPSSTLYFAYGRNMGTHAMEFACPGHGFVGAAELREHRLAFTRRSLRTRTGVADILAAAGQSVWGALYELDDAHLAAIDEKEGNGWAYERRAVRVMLGAGAEEREALAYTVIAPDSAHVPPSEEYARALLDGARERGLPEAYVRALAALIAAS